MAAVPMHMRADRNIMKRQQQELAHEQMVAAHLDTFKVEQKGLWENRMVGVIRNNRVKSKAAALEAQHRASLQERRRKLAQKLSAEQAAYEKEMVDREETPQQRMDKMAVRAYELKKRREDERKAMVQEKLYQQWRAGIDDLRAMDSRIVELKVIADRDYQLDEKSAVKAEERAHDEFYDRLWHEGYLAKIEREEREKELKRERNDQQKRTLVVQTNMKAQKAREERDQEEAEVTEMKKLWRQQAEEEKEHAVQERINAKLERKKADEYMAIQQKQKADEEALDKEFDRQFITSVLDRERKLAEQEEAEKTKAKKKAIEFTEALKIEMAKKAEGEEALIKLQHEESERQWAKRYASWEKEELARRNLMEEVYSDRAEQVRLKQDQREQLKDELANEKELAEREVKRLEAVEKERVEGEALVQKRHQEELFRQMDFHQVQRHRQLQQHAIEQRQAAIAEEKIRRAVAGEKAKSTQIMKEVMDRRAQKTATQREPAPWDK